MDKHTWKCVTAQPTWVLREQLCPGELLTQPRRETKAWKEKGFLEGKKTGQPHGATSTTAPHAPGSSAPRLATALDSTVSGKLADQMIEALAEVEEHGTRAVPITCAEATTLTGRG